MIFDTDVLIWFFRGNEKAKKIVRENMPFSISAVSYMELLQGALNKQELYDLLEKNYKSFVSLWEIAIKLAIKKLDLQGIEISDLVQFCSEQNIEIVQLPVSAVKKYAAIPIKENHKDPFDRALIALCISDDYVFLSHDGKLEQYTQDGLVFIS